MKSKVMENETFVIMQEYFGAEVATTHIKQFPPETGSPVVKSSRLSKRKFAAGQGKR